MSRQSRWIYRDMMDVYYDAELPLSLDIDALCDSLGVESMDDRTIVERLLRFKFIKTDEGYRHDICEKVIAEYRAKAKTAQTNGKLGGRPRKEISSKNKPSGFQSGSYPDASGVANESQSEANQEPRTNNHKPEQNPAPATDHKPDARGVTAVDLSIAFRKAGIMTQPANPVLIELAEQGVTVETVVAACDAAATAKPGERVPLGYVVSILKRWAADAGKVKVQGAAQPRASPGGQYQTANEKAKSLADRLTGKKQHEPIFEFIDINPPAAS